MNTLKSAVERYVEDILLKNQEVESFIKQSSILLTENEEGLVWDIMILIPDDLFLNKVICSWDDCFAIDDHNHNPWVFARVKNYKWLRQDFYKRLPIALWIFQNSLIIRDREDRFAGILREQQEIFANSVNGILGKKYIEFRTERHNLRHAIKKQRKMASIIIKAAIVKLALEICFLAEDKPYPYKKLLPEAVVENTTHGKKVYQISECFLEAEDPDSIIELSDTLVQAIALVLKETNLFSENFLQQWWLHLE
ncbi:hypothetical protein KJ980_08645 [Patescibacteria group bacterium]|nr:hypothetical protein [Patescibacteria group bacterium]